jgi:protein phosphatase
MNHLAHQTTTAQVTLQLGSRTDVGRKRHENEDSLLAASPVFIVADGMGGLDAGSRASAAVIAEFESSVGRTGLSVDDAVAAVDRARALVRTVSESTVRGAGTTLTGLVLVEHEDSPQWLVLNVGDSRVYRLHGGELHQLTVDHSLVQQLLDDGSLLQTDVATFARKNVITRALGAGNSTADYWLRPVENGERLLVCSDGLSGELSDESIKAGVLLGGTPQETADRLLSSALEHGGRDNISVIVIDVIAGGVNAWPGVVSADDRSDAIDTRADDTRPVRRVARDAAR